MLCATENWKRGGFGLYIHWPFCEAKCPYCDFNSYVQDHVDQDDWITAYLSEIKRLSEGTADRRLSSVFFGGGTPSLMEGRTVGRILEAAQKVWDFAEDIEISLEANPSSVERSRFAEFRAAGVNRISLGVQALNDDLKKLGRVHSVKEALAAMDTARALFDRTSFDLIYARQDQSLDAWEDELTRALSFEPDHLSLYQLTIEPETVFGRRYDAGRLPGLPDDDLAADLFELTQKLTTDHGLPAYEVSNHARPGSECRHNLIYWRGGDYLGIGPGAHGRWNIAGTRYESQTHLNPQIWLAKTRSSGGGFSKLEALSAEAVWQDYLFMALRLEEGADIGNLPSQKKLHNKINNLIYDDLLLRDDNRLRTTPKGRTLLNQVLSQLLFE